MGSEREYVEPSGAVRLDDHCNLRVGDEVGKVGGDDEGGEGVLGVGPVPVLLLNIARQEQARHTTGYQTAPVWFLRQLTHGLLSSIAASKGCGRWRQPRSQSRCQLENKSGHWSTQCKDRKLSSFSEGDYIVVGRVWTKMKSK